MRKYVTLRGFTRAGAEVVLAVAPVDEDNNASRWQERLEGMLIGSPKDFDAMFNDTKYLVFQPKVFAYLKIE